MDPFPLHQQLMTATGLSYRYVFYRDHWREWMTAAKEAGWTIEDLILTTKYLMREVNLGKRNPGALKLNNLLQPVRFDSDLVLARRERATDKKQPAQGPDRWQSKLRDLFPDCEIPQHWHQLPQSVQEEVLRYA